MQAIILAGGFGSRIRSVLGDIPKPMAPIYNGKKQIPFLEILIRNLKNHGVKKVLIAVYFLKEKIINHFEKLDIGISIEYVIENEPLGTGGAIKNAMQYVDEEKFFVVNGDTFLECDYKKMFLNNELTIALLHRDDCGRYGKVEVNNSYITRFIEKGDKGSGLINGGIYLITKKDLLSLPKVFSFEKDFLHCKKKIRSYITNGYFIDIGVPEDYREAKENLCKDASF